jgi:MYXO-CTERM domain-containing protein
VVVDQVPEPSAASLAGLAALGLAAVRRRGKKGLVI